MAYPEFGHLGFKILATIWGIYSINYMSIGIAQQSERNKILSLIAEQQKQALKNDAILK